jgi:predicted PurR-regulated permease PerM
VYIVVAALIDTGDQIVASLKTAAQDLAEHFGAAGTSLDDLASNAKELLSKFGGTAASGVISGVSVVGETIAMAVLALLLVFFFLRDSHRAVDTLRSLAPRTSGAVAVLVALADRGFVIALWVLGVVLAVQVLEGHVLQPVIQSRTVQMHPAVVMVAITAGASVAGILGMLLAVPLTAAAFGVGHELRELYSGASGASGAVDS